MENKSLEQRMETEPVHRVILSLAAPTVLSMLVISAYSIVDTFFVQDLAAGQPERSELHLHWWHGYRQWAILLAWEREALFQGSLERKKKSRQSRLQIRQLCQGCCLDL